MSDVRVEWNGDLFKRQVETIARKKIHAATITVQSRAKVLLSVPGTGHNVKGKVVPSRTGMKGKKLYGAFPSKPGEPPHKQKGHLRRSVATEQDGLIGRVGTNVSYGKILELGGRTVKARPWLRRALAESRNEIDRIFHS